MNELINAPKSAIQSQTEPSDAISRAENVAHGQSKALRFKYADLTSIWDLHVPMDWLVSDLIPEHGVAMLSGASGCGKSTFCLALADAVAHGKTFLNRQCKQRDVMIVDKENGAGIYCQRIKRLRLQETEKLHVWGLWSSPSPEGPGAAEIADFAKSTEGLIIFDSLIAFNSGDEQSAGETRKYMDLFRNLTAHKATCLVIHHTGKGENTKKYRGSSDIEASLDTALLLESEPNLQLLKLTPFKTREGTQEPIQIKYEDGQFISVGDQSREAVYEVIRQRKGINTTEIFKACPSIPEKKVKEILHRGVANESLATEKGMNNSRCYTVRGGD